MAVFGMLFKARLQRQDFVSLIAPFEVGNSAIPPCLLLLSRCSELLMARMQQMVGRMTEQEPAVMRRWSHPAVGPKL